MLVENNKTWQPVKDYARINKVSVQAVYQAIKSGALQVKKIGTYTLVSK